MIKFVFDIVNSLIYPLETFAHINVQTM